MPERVPPAIRVWLAGFVLLTIVGLTIQLGILPYIAPSLHGGHGLVANTDSVTFHRAAVDISRAIEKDGWKRWQLRPAAWGHVGISSAVYALAVPEPWVLVPVAAALLALAIMMLFHVLRLIGLSPEVSALASLVLAVLPSTVMLAAQWHKDQIAIPSAIGMILGCLLLGRGDRVLVGTLAIGVGTFGLWLVRDHIIEVMAGAATLGTLTAAGTIRWANARDVRALLRVSMGTLGILALSQSLPSWTDNFAVSTTEWEFRPDGSGVDRKPAPSRATPPTAVAWHASRWIPAAVDRRIAGFVQVREASIRGTGHGCSSIDTDVSFTSVSGLVAYTPRATAIALLAPFPARWFGAACSGGGRLLSVASAVEMIVAYVAFLGIPLLVWEFRRQSSVWFVLLLCLSALIIHGFIFVNVGTIFRTRYAWFATLVVLGAAGWMRKWARAESDSGPGRLS